jgi:hypothetical protein
MDSNLSESLKELRRGCRKYVMRSEYVPVRGCWEHFSITRTEEYIGWWIAHHVFDSHIRLMADEQMLQKLDTSAKMQAKCHIREQRRKMRNAEISR